MKTKRKALKHRLICVFVILMLTLIAVVISVMSGLDEHIEEIASYHCKAAAGRVMLSAADETIAQQQNTQLYFLQRDDSGRITSAQLDPAAANKLKTCLEKNISLELEKLGEDGIDIPIGTLTGINYLSGKGSGVNIGIAQIGSASSELNSVFESAGINQTRLRLSVTVTVTISAILPTGSTKIRMKEEYLLCDSLIVGEVPEKYGGEGVYL